MTVNREEPPPYGRLLPFCLPLSLLLSSLFGDINSCGLVRQRERRERKEMGEMVSERTPFPDISVPSWLSPSLSYPFTPFIL